MRLKEWEQPARDARRDFRGAVPWELGAGAVGRCGLHRCHRPRHSHRPTFEILERDNYSRNALVAVRRSSNPRPIYGIRLLTLSYKTSRPRNRFTTASAYSGAFLLALILSASSAHSLESPALTLGATSAIRVYVGIATVSGGPIPKPDLQVAGTRAALRSCVNPYAGRDLPHDDVLFTVTIDTDGNVIATVATGGADWLPEVRDCMLARLAGWHFWAPDAIAELSFAVWIK